MENESIYRIIQGVIILVFVLHRAYYNRKYPPSEEDTLEAQSPSFLTPLAEILMIPALLGLVAYLINPIWMGWSTFAAPLWARWVGVVLSVRGFGLLQWSHWALGRNWSDQPRIKGSQTLTTSGPYQWVRHPIYTSFLLILGSTLLITMNWFIGMLWLTATGIDVRERIAFEEERLRSQFGDAYGDYAKQTGRLLPRIG
jgi:protein-S-isoprenylcysteine O-methyltransferase Ste14